MTEAAQAARRQATYRLLLSWLQGFAYLMIAELLLFKLGVLLFGAYELLESLALVAGLLVTVLVIILLGLSDQALIALVLLLVLGVLMPGSALFLEFYRDNPILLLLHWWIPLYFCRPPPAEKPVAPVAPVASVEPVQPVQPVASVEPIAPVEKTDKGG